MSRTLAPLLAMIAVLALSAEARADGPMGASTAQVLAQESKPMPKAAPHTPSHANAKAKAHPHAKAKTSKAAKPKTHAKPAKAPAAKPAKPTASARA